MESRDRTSINPRMNIALGPVQYNLRGSQSGLGRYSEMAWGRSASPKAMANRMKTGSGTTSKPHTQSKAVKFCGHRSLKPSLTRRLEQAK